MVNLLWTGRDLADVIKSMGSDQGGISDFTYDRISKEHYKRMTIPIQDLRASDPHLDSYLKTAGVREYEKSDMEMPPVVTSQGEVLDGYNRIAQAIEDNEDTITILKGIINAPNLPQPTHTP